MKKLNFYESPILSELEVVVEAGFSATGGGNGWGDGRPGDDFDNNEYDDEL